MKLRERDEANYNAGRAAGFEEGIRKIVKNMIVSNIATEICEITGCTQEFIDSIRNSEKQ